MAFFPLLLLFFLVSQKINLTTSDLGRHLMNGQLLWGADFFQLLTSNFYSYSHPDFTFINHHWLTGVVLHFIYSMIGFPGLVVTHSLLLVLSLGLMRNRKYPRLSFCISLSVIPLIAFRGEVRPEDFSCVFLGLFFLLQNNKKARYFFPLFMILWVNLHVYFILGFVILFFQGLELWSHEKQAELKRHLVTALLCCVAVFCNPIGYKLVFYPLNIFNDFGYMVLEIQSTWFCFQRGIYRPEIILFWILFTGFMGSVSLQTVSVGLRKLPWGRIGPTFFVGVLAGLAVRNMAMFGILLAGAWPALGMNFQSPRSQKFLIALSSLTLSCMVWIKWDFITQHFGFGLNTSLKSVEFFKANGLRGPVLNNYDIGGYLIFNLFPAEKVFVDNRPEAYPSEFFKKIYQPMQEDEIQWQKQLDHFKFNVIFFYRLDQTPWAQPFLFRRTQDPDWTPIYVDDESLILVRNTEQNAREIRRHALPREIFSSRGN